MGEGPKFSATVNVYVRIPASADIAKWCVVSHGPLFGEKTRLANMIFWSWGWILTCERRCRAEIGMRHWKNWFRCLAVNPTLAGKRLITDGCPPPASWILELNPDFFFTIVLTASYYDTSESTSYADFSLRLYVYAYVHVTWPICGVSN